MTLKIMLRVTKVMIKLVKIKMPRAIAALPNLHKRMRDAETKRSGVSVFVLAA